MERPRLFLSRDVHWDRLSAIEFGSVDDGQPDEHWLGLSEQVGFLLASPFGPPIGFVVNDFSELDLDDEEHEELWDGPRFDVPVLGLSDVSPARSASPPRPTSTASPPSTVSSSTRRVAGSEGDLEEAVAHWRMCLETGDLMAHYGLGYTLHELGRYREAYRHLRAYTEITPHERLGLVLARLHLHGHGRAGRGARPTSARSSSRRRAATRPTPASGSSAWTAPSASWQDLGHGLQPTGRSERRAPASAARVTRARRSATW